MVVLGLQLLNKQYERCGHPTCYQPCNGENVRARFSHPKANEEAPQLRDGRCRSKGKFGRCGSVRIVKNGDSVGETV